MNTKLLLTCSKHQCKDNFNKSLILPKIKRHITCLYIYLWPSYMIATGTVSVPFRAECYINFDGETSKHSKMHADFGR